MAEREPTGRRAGTAGEPPVVLEMRGITKTFGSVRANDGISISLRKGEVLGILGENGAGKSTLMKILYGLYSPDAGEIFLDGERVEIKDPKDAVERGIGMVHQHFTLIPPLTVAENIVLGAEPRRGLAVDFRRAVRETGELCERYGLRVDPRARVAELSVGEQQRVEILKALYREARILVLDEPTAVLTPQETEDLFSTLKELVAAGLSVILITHKLGELLGVSDRITIIRDGRVVDTVMAAETDERELARLMVGREVLLRLEKEESRPGGARLEAEGLVVRSGTGAVAVHGVSLRVRGGEIVGIAGVDGNGQTELAEALAGTRPLEDGTVRLDGEDVSRLGAKARKRRGLAYVPEDRMAKGLVPDFALYENNALKTYDEPPYASRWGWLRPAVMHRRAAEVLRTFDVRPPDPDLPARALSGGNQQKAILARELSGDPGVIIAYQPTRGVDVGAIEFIHGQLLRQREEGKAILLISLELEEIRSLSDRILVIFDGRIVGEVGPGATDEELGLLMAGRGG
ncbi:ABC transporter [Rubrobacter xylanophilus]|uniref:ABC transporter n=2 Tax=Rubrobacter xylanophilus TaxID=49319 RepID=A0A510HJX5_9ACTN|nr:ABC transporter [Rubrobacter xylanophilus]